MIRNQWYAVLESKELPKGKLIGVTRFSEKLVFWRTNKSIITCLRDKCIHRGAALSIGKICDNGETVECPFHGLRYNSKGRCTIIPANGKNAPVPDRFKVHYYPTRERYGFIWVWWGDLQDDYPSLPFFSNLDDKFSYKTHTEVWPVHYTRAIENQLDSMHLPFVHYNTIGRGHRTIVHGPLVEEMEDKRGFIGWTINVKDDGKTRPYTPQEFPDELKVFHFSFRFPHLWQLHLAEKARIFIAFVPIDEENTLFYLRFYQKVMRILVLRNIINWIAMMFNKKVLHQDRRVVITQQPIKTQLKMGEKLIQGDNPIVYYRKRREELLLNNN
ncbi:MAG: Rieske 2Fe-2S domain-containing protein [Candidatus Thorarchaeota archaeon]